MSKYFLSALFFFACFQSQADVESAIEKIESGYLTEQESLVLFQQLEQNLPYTNLIDNARVIAFKCWFYSPTNDTEFEEFEKYLKRSFKLAEEVAEMKLLVDLHTCKAQQLYIKGEIEAATKLLKKVISDTASEASLINEKANAHLILSRIYSQSERMRESFNHANLAFESFKEAPNPYYQALMMRDIGLIHAKLHNFSLAVEQIKRALYFLEPFNEQETYKTLGDLGSVYMQAGEFEKALSVYKNMGDLVRKYEDSDGQMYLYLDMAYAAIKLKDITLATQLVVKLNSISTKSDILANLRLLISTELLLLNNNFEQALTSFASLTKVNKSIWTSSEYSRVLSVSLELAKFRSDTHSVIKIQQELLERTLASLSNISDGKLLSDRLTLELEQRQDEIVRLRVLNQLKEQLLLTEQEKANYQWIVIISTTILILVVIIFARKQLIHKEKYKIMALRDELTGIPNRRAIFAFNKNVIENMRDLPPSLISIDIDFFKAVNDTYGHDVGDELIKSVADILTAEIRQTDKAGRVGGEEFLIVLPATDINSAIEISERIRKRVEIHPHTHLRLSVTVSIGVIQVTQGESLSEISKRLDKLLYEAKNSGRNRVMAGL